MAPLAQRVAENVTGHTTDGVGVTTRCQCLPTPSFFSPLAAGPFVLFPFCWSDNGFGCVPWTLYQRGFHGSLLQTASGETHSALRSGIC